MFIFKRARQVQLIKELGVIGNYKDTKNKMSSFLEATNVETNNAR